MPPIISFRNVTLGYGRKQVLSNLTFDVDKDDYFGIVGPNGAGKTTLLRAILGTLAPMSGSVHTESSHGGPLHLGYVPQRDSIDDILPYTVAEVVMMGRYKRIGLIRRPGKNDREAVVRALDYTGIASLKSQIFKDLSGGQKQRVLIARALATEPEVLVLDEPTNGMDLPSRITILDLIRRVHEEGALTVIMVSHLLDDVANHVRNIAIVEKNFFQVGSIEEVLTGANLTKLYGMSVVVEEVLGRKTILPGGMHAAR
jgi:manganese/zinc/iron transport system ATP- binding protein